MAAAGAMSNFNKGSSRANTSQTALPEHNNMNLIEEDSPISFEEHPLAWDKFEQENITLLRQLTPPELERELADTLHLTDYKLSLSDGAKLDYFVGGFLFCSEQNFDFFQTSSFMGVLDKILNNCQSQMTLEENIAELVRYLREMNNLKPNTSPGIEGFTTEQSKKVIDFVHEGIFQHYSLYQNLLVNEQQLDTMEKMLEIEVVPPGDVPFPPPLHEGIPLELYDKYVAPPVTTMDEVANPKDMSGAVLTGDMGATDEEDRTTAQFKQANAAELIIKSLKPEEIKNIVAKLTEETLQSIKTEADSKIKEREAIIVSKMNRLHLT